MTGLVTLRDPAVLPAAPPPDDDELDPETAYRAAIRAGWDETVAAGWAAWLIGLPIANGETGPIPWSMREVRHLRFYASEYDFGSFVGDRDDEEAR